MIGQIVRYGEGPSALMRVTSINNNRYYGEQYFGGGVSAHEWDVQPASKRDRRAWAQCHNGDDTWQRGRYSYVEPTHVILHCISKQGRSYFSKVLSLTTPYKMDNSQSEAELYESFVVGYQGRVVGRWLIRNSKVQD